MRPRKLVSVVGAVVLAGTAALTAGAAPAFARGRTGTIAGTVHDTRGAVVAGATIVVYPADPSGSEVGRVTTGLRGTFGMDALPSGRYRVLIDRDGWSEWAPGRITDPTLAYAYQVRPGHTTVVTCVVTAPGRIAGRVTTPAGKPAAGIAVAVYDPSASEWDTTTAADGTYSAALPPGSGYIVSFTNGELLQHSPRTLVWSEAMPYTVTTGRTTRVDERLIAPAVLTGRLVDETGAPVAGAQVYVNIAATAGAAETVTGPDGSYRFDAMPPGIVVVGFHTLDGRQQWAFQKLVGDEADLITLTLGVVTTVDDTLLPVRTPVG